MAETKKGLTTDPNDPRIREIDADGKQTAYLILSDEERAKGFVRPVRDSYVHVGRKVCGLVDESKRNADGDFVCTMAPGHDGPCTRWAPCTRKEMDRLQKTGLLGGCGETTVMGKKLAETYARKPDFYSGTYCCTCKDHFPVGPNGEFVWSEKGTVTDIRVGT